MNIAIIPVREKSKSIKEKNLISFCGKPLIYWTVKQAQESNYIDRIFITTDWKMLKEYTCKTFPFINIIDRPKRLARDNSSSEEALLHAIKKIKCKEEDIVCFLQATSPLRESSDINNCIEYLIKNKEADCIFSISKLKDNTIWKEENDGKLVGALFDPKNRNIMRQNRETYFYENGSIYCFRVGGFLESKNRIFGASVLYEMPFWKSFEIDEIEDIELCEFYFERKELKYELDM